MDAYFSASAEADGSDDGVVPGLVGEKPSGSWDGSELGAAERLMVALAGTDQSDRTTVSKPSHRPLSSTFVTVKVCSLMESPLL